MEIRILADRPGGLSLKVSGKVAPDGFGFDREPILDLCGPDVYGRGVLLSLEETHLLNSCGVGWLLVCHKRFEKARGRLVVHSIPRLVEPVIKLMRLDQVLHVARDAMSAQAKLPEPSAIEENSP